MDGFKTAILALLALLVILTGKDAIPTLIFVLMPGALRFSFDDSSKGQEPLSKHGDLHDWLLKLQELGFTLLGVKVEKLPLWGPEYRELALASREAEAYASIVLHRDGSSPASLYIYTPFQDGGMVFTRNYEPAPEAEGDRLSVKNVPTSDFKTVLASHVGRLRVFTERGLRPLVGLSRQAKIEATRIFYASEYSHRPALYVLSPCVLGFFLSLLLLLLGVFGYVIV